MADTPLPPTEVRRFADGIAWLLLPPGDPTAPAGAVARCLGIAADAVVLDHEASGRPVVAGQPGVGVSLSRAAGHLAVATSHAGPVGIDIEHVRPVPDWRAVARDALGDDVVRTIEAQAPEERPRAFLLAWTRHEARAKHAGTGLGVAAAPTVPTQALPDLPDDLVGALAADGLRPEGPARR